MAPDARIRPQSQAIYFYDTAKGGNLLKVMDEIDAVDITRDGGKILYRKGRDYFLTGAEAAAKPGEGIADGAPTHAPTHTLPSSRKTSQSSPSISSFF